MKDKCLDIGTIQAFTDGELAHGSAERVIRHVSVCDGCAALLAETEEETSLAFSLLDEEINVLVPTERLRAKVLGSIKELEEARRYGWWKDIAAGLTAAISFRNPGFVAFAATVLFVSALGIGVSLYTPSVGTNEVIVAEAETTDPVIVPPVAQTGNRDQEEVAPVNAGDAVSEGPVRAQQANYGAPVRDRRPMPADTSGQPAGDTVLPSNGLAPEVASEASFLQTIATLDQTVDYSKESLRPTERVAFERDLAMVDDAIVKMKEEVRKNPNNQAAREVLKASYQNKIDLLNSVAEKTELMASLQ